MANSLNDLSSPVEIRLRKGHLDVTGVVAHEDQTTEPLRVKSVDLRGAQREVTHRLRQLGYETVAIWETTTNDDGSVTTRRVFRRLDE